MNTSLNILHLIEELNKFSSYKIKNNDDISFLLEITNHSENKELFDDLIFTAKYLNGLGKILHNGLRNTYEPKGDSSSINPDTLKKIREEYKANMEKIISQFKHLIKNAAQDTQINFEGKYMAMTQQSMVNLTSLIYDLCWVKKFLNSKK